MSRSLYQFILVHEHTHSHTFDLIECGGVNTYATNMKIDYLLRCTCIYINNEQKSHTQNYNTMLQVYGCVCVSRARIRYHLNI